MLQEWWPCRVGCWKGTPTSAQGNGVLPQYFFQLFIENTFGAVKTIMSNNSHVIDFEIDQVLNHGPQCHTFSGLFGSAVDVRTRHNVWKLLRLCKAAHSMMLVYSGYVDHVDSGTAFAAFKDSKKVGWVLCNLAFLQLVMEREDSIISLFIIYFLKKIRLKTVSQRYYKCENSY